MDNQNLIDMANRIGDFFDSMPDREEALAGIADHIRRFWEPRMRRALLAALDEPDASGIEMSGIVREALVKHRDGLTPAAATAVRSKRRPLSAGGCTLARVSARPARIVTRPPYHAGRPLRLTSEAHAVGRSDTPADPFIRQFHRLASYLAGPPHSAACSGITPPTANHASQCRSKPCRSDPVRPRALM